MEQLLAYWQQAKDATSLVMAFLARAKDAPREIWAGSAGQAGTRFFIVLVLIAVAFGLIALAVSFIKAGWREKLHILFVTVLALMVLGVILWYGLRQAEETALPEAEAITLGDVSALAYPQYTLDHDEGDAYWYLADDVFTVQAGDGLALQLTGLSDVAGKPFLVNAFRREDGNLYALLLSSDFSSSATGDIRGWGSNTFAELHVIPGGDMTEQPWYGWPGDTRTDGYTDYTVLENDGGSVTFLLEDGWLGDNGEPLRALCLARQEGPDVVWSALRTISTQIDYRMTDSNERGNDAEPIYTDYDPAADEDLRAELTRTAAELLDGHAALLRGLSGEELAALLPERVTAPGDGKGRGFSVPCTELEELGGDETSQFIRFYGTDTDGNTVLYTLQNGGVLLMNDRTAEYEAWSDAYNAGKTEPDAAMSMLLGGTAVAYEDGWLMNPGDFIRLLISQENYYYLTAER